MRIVTQSAQISHTLFPPYLLLCAPKSNIAGYLCAPKIAGLLPADVLAARPPKPRTYIEEMRARYDYEQRQPLLAQQARAEMFKAASALARAAMALPNANAPRTALYAAEERFRRAARAVRDTPDLPLPRGFQKFLDKRGERSIQEIGADSILAYFTMAQSFLRMNGIPVDTRRWLKLDVDDEMTS